MKNWLLQESAGKFVLTLCCCIVIWLVVTVSRKAVVRGIKDIDIRYRSRKFIIFAGYVAAFIIIIGIYNNNLQNVTVALGIAGAGIAFALQEVIGSVAGWLTIMFGGFYKTGDRVQLGGIKGDVIDIGVLRTTLMEIGQWVDGDLYNGRIVRVANSFVFKEPVFNYSADFHFLWDEVKLSVQYQCDHKKVKELFLAIANEVCGNNTKEAQHMWDKLLRKYRVEDASTEPMVSMVAKDNWIEYTIRYVSDYKKRRSTKDRLFTRILEEAARNNDIKFAAATVTAVQWINPPDLPVGVHNMTGQT